MPSPLRDYQWRRIDLALARQRAQRTHAQPCNCPYCITQAEVDRILRERIEAEHRRAGPVPF